MFRNGKLLISGLLRGDRCQQQRFLHESSATRRPRKLPFVRLTLGAAVAFVAYDGVRHEFTHLGAAVRFARSLRTAAVITVDYLLLERHESDANYKEQLQVVHQRSADRLLATCLRNGGLYIKVGQGFAAINHILPKEYTDTLAQLQDKCLPTTRADVQKLFRQDFDGQLPEQVYAEFEYEPVAAASLAQVFKARLHTGEQVAVKVQYSDLQRRFPSDLGTIIFLHDLIDLFFKNYNMGWILRDVHKNLMQELNFMAEGRNAERCARDLAKFQYVHVPAVHWQHTKRRVLTLEWIDGIKINEVERLKDNRLNLRDVDTKLFELFAEQIFNSGFVHADPHAGNIFVRRNAQGKAELVLLDHGLYEELPEALRMPLCEFWEATVLRDERAMQAAARQIGIKDHMKFAEVLFQQPIRIHGGHIKTKLTQVDIDYMQKVAMQNFDLIMSTLKEMPLTMLFVVRNLNTVRAIGRHHGDVVDRPRLMARYAQRCLYSRYNSLVGSVRWLCRRVRFEYCLWRTAWKMHCLTLYFNILYRLGRAPESATTMLQGMMSSPTIS